jgi:hypothetical protein
MISLAPDAVVSLPSPIVIECALIALIKKYQSQSSGGLPHQRKVGSVSEIEAYMTFG